MNQVMDWHESPGPRPVARVEIDPTAVRRNLRRVAEHAGRPALCVVKADAYGHGAARIAPALEAEPSCRGFAVARMEEAAALRPALSSSQPILCFGTWLAARTEAERREVLATSRSLGIEPVLASAADVQALVAMPSRHTNGLRFHLAVETGMTREGVEVDALARVIPPLIDRGMEIRSLWTHFASSEDPEAEETKAQLSTFASAAEALPEGIGVHLENSAAALHRLGSRLPEALQRRLLATRVGGALYGLDLREGGHEPRLEQVMRVSTRIVQLRRVTAGTAVGYGGTWVAPRDSVVGLAAVGYADGVRAPTPDLIWHGPERSAPVPVVGRVSMDLISVDCTDAMQANGEGRGPEVGDELIVLGSSRGLVVDARSHAEAAGVVEYAVTVGFSLRLPRYPQGPPDRSKLPPGAIL